MKPVMITLQQIRDAGPCESGWKNILNARGGTGADYSAEFHLADALNSNSLSDVLWATRCVDSPAVRRIVIRFGAWAARQVMHLNPDPRVLAAIEAAERCADNRTPETVKDAADAADAAYAAARAADAAYAADAADAAARAAYAAYAAYAADAADAAARAADAADDADDADAADAAYAAARVEKLRTCLMAGEWVE